ncbi:hypothetical protein AB0C68_08320 [Streptomyces tendae]|uniref:hypothetical protein n=1 Tax=Streptomyces tendae TaxID=1932 RepID=UPI0033D7427D
MSGDTSRAGLFVVLEGADGSGKSAIAAELARLLEAEGRKVAPVLRDDPPAADSRAGLVRAVGRLFDEAKADGTRISTLSLAAAAQYSALLDSQVEPALDKGVIMIAESWWAKTWARLAIEAVRRGEISGVAAATRFQEWQRTLLPGREAIAPRHLTILVEAPQADRQAWYEQAGCPSPVYDLSGRTSYAPEVYGRFTQELAETLHGQAARAGWMIVGNDASRSPARGAVEIGEAVRKRLCVLKGGR